MSYEDFYKEIERVLEKSPRSLRSSDYWSGKQEETIQEAAISIYWSIGGASGGAVEGGEAQEYQLDESEYDIPHFEDLDILLSHFFPNLTYEKYHKYTEKLTHDDSYSELEYYGNYTGYKRKYVLLIELYDLWLNKDVA